MHDSAAAVGGLVVYSSQLQLSIVYMIRHAQTHPSSIVSDSFRKATTLPNMKMRWVDVACVEMQV